MQYRLFTFFILFFTFFLTQAQEKTDANIQLIKDFIQQVSIETISPDVILNQHVLLKETSTDEEYDYLEASIEEIRVNLQTKNIDEIEYLTFNSLPKKETNDIDLEGKSVDHIYFLKYKKRQMLAIYITENKIASFTLVAKENNKARFITY
ncbi:hypothetical protein ORI89_00805 [Sphingobacterium sp. UT-1RO-CII-1]|uniref:hypothetical protein n=1 Tax=Sphingobacterium sp. UT-1RO-CII-1 TaxID=2995225 RepID=UPI00227C62B4|nr:hypothetical protein [Sphingobacterium sp. UT-1RO-CII-1]MCY4778172.1 hypothetical protein [Sphingobacterium sp. UT-1RO-CII-1]